MKFNNIERNILYLLGKEKLKSGSLGPFDTRWIFDKFSDIPDKHMKAALRSMKAGGFAKVTPNYRSISLTQKGLSKIKFIDLPGNGKLPFPRELE
jgi:hypothetical protein